MANVNTPSAKVVVVPGDTGAEVTWTFGADGTTLFPGDDILAPINNNLRVTVQDQENDGWAVFNVVTDGANTLASTRLQRQEFRVTTDQAGAPKIWKFDNTGNLTLPANTFSINYANGTQVPLGGNANTGNVTFSNQIVIGTGLDDGTGGLYLATGPNGSANLQYLRVRGGDFATHIHLDTGNNSFYDQYFGNDNKYVKLGAGDTGNIVIGTDDGNGNLYSWTFNSTGNVNLPTISLGAGVDEQTYIRSQRKVIPPNRYSVEITGSTPTIVYTASTGTQTIKTTLVVQHISLGFEMFDVSALGAGANVLYSVSNRLNSTGQPNTTAVVDWSGGVLAITLTVNSGATTSYVTYDSTEFGIAND
jgi:hypothetical protein